MRATNGLQTTITLSPVNSDGQAFSLELTLGDILAHAAAG